jgi:beta-galactosidase GanA
MDDPEFAGLVCNFIENATRHFSHNPSLFVCVVWNEPHLEPMFDYASNMLCYCKHSRFEFVRWLQNKYKTIEALSDAWYRKYSDWSQVEPPPRFGTWADMLDWRKFWLENISRWLSLRVAASRKGAPDIPVQTHVAYSGILGNCVTGGLANELGDEFILAKQVDMFGLSSFPRWLMMPEHYYRHFIHNEMIAQASGTKPFYQIELQGGGGKPGLLGGEVPTADDIRIWNYNTVAAGGKGTIYWQYAPEPTGLESPGFGLTGFMGENTPRSLSAGDCVRELNTGVLDRSKRVPITNAVYISRKTDLLCFSSERREEFYVKSLSGFFKAAYSKGIPCRFFHEDQLDTLLSSGIKILYLPMPLVISSREADVLAAFVLNGGTLISEACPGLYQDTGLLDQQCGILKQLFHVNHVEIQSLPEHTSAEVTLPSGASFSGAYYRQLVTLDDTTVAGGFFEDGSIAVAEYRHGKGKAVWIGTYPAAYFEINADKATGEFLSAYLDKTGYGVIQSLSLTWNDNNAFPLVPIIRLLETDTSYVVVMINHSRNEARLSIRFSFSPEPMDIFLPGHGGKIVERLKQ